MAMRTRSILVCGALALAVPAMAGAAEEAAKVVEEVCSSCHTPSVRPIDKMHFTREQWAEALDRMQGMGVDLPKKKVAEVVDYLARTQGPEHADADKK
jgi:hypothetical protein